MKHVLAVVAVCLLAFPLIATAQDKKPPVDVWGSRSESITSSIIGDAPSLESFNRALLFARLGDAWWEHDRERARSWMQKAVETVEYMPDQQSPAEHAQRVATARALLTIVRSRDENIVGPLNEILEADLKNGSKTPNDQNAEALIKEALAVVKRDPQRAALLGAQSLRVGNTPLLQQLLWELRARDVTLADGLFTQAVIVARKTYDSGLLWSLLHVSFPVLSGGKPGRSDLPDLLRAQLAEAVVIYFQHAHMTLKEPAALCSQTGSLIFVVAQIRSELERLVPAEQSTFLRQLINGCQSSLSPIVQERVKESERSQPLKTVEDFLEAAGKVKDSSAKTVLLARAAWLAVEQKKFERAISILEDIDTDGRKFLNGQWEVWRSNWAGDAALEHLRHDDLDGMRRVIEAVPAGLRPPSQISVAYGASPQKHADLIVGMLRDARDGLPKSDLNNDEKLQWYQPLLKLYAKFVPDDAFGVLAETIATLNRIEAAKARAGKDLDDPAKSQLIVQSRYNLPLSMLESDEFAFLNAISSIESPTQRAKIRLELLSNSLSQAKRSKVQPASSKF